MPKQTEENVRVAVCDAKVKLTRLGGAIHAVLLALVLGVTSYSGCIRGEFNSHVAAESVRDNATAGALQEIKKDVEYIRQNLPGK